MTVQVLKKQAIQEAIKCGRDPIYFIEKYCKISHPVKGLIPFKLYNYQKEAIKTYLCYDNVIINKARQLGFSTLTAAFIVWLVYFHKNKHVLVVSTKADVAKNLIKKVKLILSELPDWLYLADVSINQAHMVGLTNNSWVKSISRSEDAGRSESLSLLVIDEAAHIRGMDQLWKGLASTIATGGKCIVLSTPKGVGNWFHKYFTEAETKENNFHPITVHWWENPEYAKGLQENLDVPGGYTSPWFEKFTKGWTYQEIAQELLASFLESGDTFIDARVIRDYEEKVLPPIEELLTDRKLWVWKKPIVGKKYIVVGDTASGGAGGNDYCAAVVMETSDCEIVAEYKNRISPDVFADFLLEVATMYNKAYIVVENNGVGLSTAITLKRSEYKNLGYFDLSTGKLIDKWTAEYNRINPGYAITQKNRPIILSKFQEFLNKKYLKCYSKRFVKELYTFVVENSKPRAISGQNDDLIMATALAIWIRDICPEFSSKSTAVDYLQMCDAVKRSAQTLDELSNYNRSDIIRQKYKEEAEKQYSIMLPNGRLIQSDWIFRI